MKKNTMFVSLILICLIFFSACSSTSVENEENKKSVNLIGEWKQVNSNSEDSWQSAMIENNEIKIYWVSDNGDTTSLYWAGSFTPSTTNSETYSWESENNHELTKSALLASTDDTKTITYENKQLNYSVTALGITTTVKLEKVNP